MWLRLVAAAQAALGSRAKEELRVSLRLMVIWAAVGLLGLTAAGFVVAAVHLALLRVLTPIGAALVMAAILLIVAGLLAVGAMLAKRPPPPVRANPAADSGAEMRQLLDQVQGAVKRHPTEAAATAIIGGVLLGISPALRRILKGLIR